MSYKGRIITFLSVFITNFVYIIYYYFRDGRLSLIELFGFPILLLLAWWFGRQYDLSQYFAKLFYKKQEELKESYAELKQSKDELLSLFENSRTFIWIIDVAKREITISKGIERMFGFSHEEIDKSFEFWLSYVHPDDLPILHHHYDELLLAAPTFCEIRMITAEGAVMWIEVTGKPVTNSRGHVIKMTGVFHDITEQKKTEERMKKIAYHDYLTGLPNRYLLDDYLQKFLYFCKRNETMMAVMFIDLDNFKMINDRYGHDTGDLILQEAGKRLSRNIREVDVSARVGGDEFIILLNDIEHDETKEIAKRIIAAINEPFVINEDFCTISTSIGISLYPDHTRDGEALIQLADAAMYTAKRSGKNQFCFYDDVDAGAQDNQSAV